MASLLPSPEAPFGFLQPINDYIVANAVPLTWTNWPMMFIIPLAPMSLLCYLVQLPNTRQWRIPIGILGAAMVARAIASYRFGDVSLNAFNNGVGVAGMHLITKYLEFGFMDQPIIDPYVARGSRSRVRASLDLAINSRMVGLGRIALDNRQAAKQNGANDPSKPDGGVKIEGGMIPHRQERWLPYTDHPNRSRPKATIRHITHTAFHFFVFDTMLSLLWMFGGTTIANPNGMPNALQSFVDRTTFVLLPKSAKPIPVPTLLVEMVVQMSLGAAVWQSISMAYHSVAALAVGSGLWEVESWEVDLFDAPWKADSLLDLWGRRWHQIFRHHFLLLSTLTLKALDLPVTPSFILPLIFFLSGGMHGLGQISMKPVPNPTILASFFILSGFGAALEAAFRRITGRRVRGLPGRIWTWSFMMYTGRIAARTWLDGGMGGNRFMPETGIRPGLWVANWVTEWVFDAVRK